MIFHENTSCITPIDRAIKRYTNAKVGTVKIYSKLSISAFLSWSNRSCFSARTVAMTNYLCDVYVVISTASTERDRTTLTGNDISNFKLRKKSKEIVRLIIVKANFYKNSIYFFTTSSTLFPYTDFNRGNFNPCIQIRCKIKPASESCFSQG